ncbi:MAG: YraN family protein [Pararhodobacter sp.]
MSGAESYRAGQSAEAQVARHYAARGLVEVARRWRGRGGEIDLILRENLPAGVGHVFVEVKKSRDFARAAERLNARQIARLQRAAEEFLAGLPGGLALPARFDVALVDGQGQIHIIENAIWG